MVLTPFLRMIKFQPALTIVAKYFFINSVLVMLAGCTTMVARTSIEPYISNKEKKEKLEILAAEYCLEKQTIPGNNQSIVLPDYPFSTDGCSRWFDESWVSCCVVHDITYWCGGSDEDRKEADQIIKQCANQKASFVGVIMYPGIRVGGSPWLPTPWRWGYGWKQWPRGYQKTNLHQDIKSILKKLDISETIEEQLK